MIISTLKYNRKLFRLQSTVIEFVPDYWPLSFRLLRSKFPEVPNFQSIRSLLFLQPLRQHQPDHQRGALSHHRWTVPLCGLWMYRPKRSDHLPKMPKYLSGAYDEQSPWMHDGDQFHWPM